MVVHNRWCPLCKEPFVRKHICHPLFHSLPFPPLLLPFPSIPSPLIRPFFLSLLPSPPQVFENFITITVIRPFFCLPLFSRQSACSSTPSVVGVVLYLCRAAAALPSSSSSWAMSWCSRSTATSFGSRSMWSGRSRLAPASRRARTASRLPSRAARKRGVSSWESCASLLASRWTRINTDSTLFTAAAQCSAVRPKPPTRSAASPTRLVLTSVSTGIKWTSIFLQLFWVVKAYAAVCCSALSHWASQVLNTEISQSSIATRLRCGGMFKMSNESVGARIPKIG